jgi:predicted Zn-ribbon and HTH transcriptional regulator
MCKTFTNHDDPRFQCDCHLVMGDDELEYGPECCQECGAPFNNANPSKSGLCPACEA